MTTPDAQRHANWRKNAVGLHRSMQHIKHMRFTPAAKIADAFIQRLLNDGVY